MYLRNRTIHVDPSVIGYQFNRQSLGARWVSRTPACRYGMARRWADG